MASDRPGQRSRLLIEIYNQVDGSVHTTVDAREAARAIGLTPGEGAAAVGFLEQEGLLQVEPASRRQRLTSRGVRLVEEPEASTAPGQISIMVLQNQEVAEGGSGTSTRPPGADENAGGHSKLVRRVVEGLAVGVVASLIAAFLYAHWQDDDSDKDTDSAATSSTTATDATTDDNSSAVTSSDSRVACGETTCVALRVVDTEVNGTDIGVYVRDCFDESQCTRKALAAQGQLVYGVCRVEGGMDVDGNTTWVRTPWHFVPGSIGADGRASASATGRSDPASDEFGYVTARNLAPAALIESLDACPVS